MLTYGFTVVMKVADIQHTDAVRGGFAGASAARAKGASMLGNMSLAAMRESQQVRMLTRMHTYADVCRRMPTHAGYPVARRYARGLTVAGTT